jgi:DeoR family glycerol-3-phosphate regulon repressor
MASAARREEIRKLVLRQGYMAIDALAQRFGVTPQTIRRDINDLSREGLLQRYHGGAGLPSSVENVAYQTRKVLLQDEKRRIAREAAQHVPDGASLFINIGTTTEAVAEELLARRSLRIITNNLNVANILANNSSFDVIVAGGMLRSRDRGIVGEATLDLIAQFKVDIGIIGISGIDLDGSLRDFDYREVQVSRAIIDNSRQVFLVADHSKFGRNALVRVCPLDRIHVLFTDRAPPAPYAQRLEAAGVTTVVADADGGRRAADERSEHSSSNVNP